MFHSAISGLFMPKLPSNLFFLNCSQCRRWPKVPLELFQKIEALTQGWPFLKALALLQGFSPSSRLSIFSSIAFSGYFNPATLFLFHLRCSLWPRPSFILRLGTFWTPPCLCLVVGKGWTAHCWSCWCCCFAGSALSQGLLFALFQGLLPALSQGLLLALSQGHSSDPWVVLAEKYGKYT